MKTQRTLKKPSLILFFSLFILFLFTLNNSQRVSAESSVSMASKLNSSATFKINGALASKNLTDDTIDTYLTISKGTILTITSETKIKSIYILFDKPPLPYTLTYDGITQNAGLFGYLHEVIPLQSSSSSIEMTLPEGKIASVFVYSEGSLPSTVQQWNAPTYDADLLVFATHSDDEALYFGPAIAMSVSQGKDVQVAYLVNHFDTRRRPHETLDSLWELGVTHYPIFGPFSDIYSGSLAHAYTIFPKDKILRYEIEQIRRFKPEVILSHDFGGEYGHGAHMALSDTLREAILLSSDIHTYTDSAVRYGVFSPLKTYIHLYKPTEILLDVYSPLASFNGISALQVARNAYKYHISQHIWPLSVIDYTYGDVRRFGLYLSLVGPDTTNNLFENVPDKIVPIDKPLPDPITKPDPQKPQETNTNLVMTILKSAGLIAIILGYIILMTQKRRKHSK